MDRLRDVVLFVVGLVAIGSLIMAAFEAFNQRVGSATFLGGLGVVCVLLCYFPQLEVLKAFGIEAKLQKTYNEAVATLASVRRLAEISARASYLVIAWGNRFDGPSAAERQAVLDQIDSQLEELKVSPEQLAEIQRPFVKIVRLDFFFLFQGVVNEYARVVSSKMTEEIHKASDPSVAAARAMEHSGRITPWSKRVQEKDWSAELDRNPLENVLNDFMPKGGEWLAERELAVVRKLKDEVVRLNAECEKKGSYTPEAVTYYDRYSRDHNVDKANQLRDEVLQ